MQSKHAIVLSTLQRVQRFMDTNTNILGTVNSSGYRHVLNDVVTALQDHAVNQSASQQIGQGETAKQRALRSALRQNHMRPIATIAAAELSQVPEFVSLRMPAPNLTPQRLVAWAGAMARAAKNYEDTFVSGGLPADFLDQLQAAADAVTKSLTDRGTSTTTQAAATAGLATMSARGRAVLRVLDSLVQPQLAGDAVLLTQWKAAKRFVGKTPPVPSTTLEAAAIGTSAVPSASSSPSAAPSAADPAAAASVPST